jgi:hypothetical protein
MKRTPQCLASDEERNLATLNSVPKFGVAFQQLAVRQVTLETTRKSDPLRRRVVAGQGCALDALAAMPTEIRAPLIQRAAAGDRDAHPPTGFG